MTDAIDVLSSHIMEMSHYQAYEGTVRDLRAVFYNSRVREAIIKHHGKDMLNVINQYIDIFAAGRNNKVKTIEIAEKLRGAFTQAAIGLNPVVFVKQLTSIPAYVSDDGVKKFIDGFTDVIFLWSQTL